MSGVWLTVAAFLSGLLGGLGMGAGAVLLLYLRLFTDMEQMAAQGVNLLFFLPIAALSLCMHAKNKLVKWRAAGLCVLAGLPMVWAGSMLAGVLPGQWLSRVFACLLAVIGVRELFYREKKK